MIDRHEEEIDRVLQALGKATAHEDMEARILRQLQGCPMIAEAKPKPSWGWALGTAAALASLLLAAALLSVSPWRRPPVPVPVPAAAALRAPAKAGRVAAAPTAAPSRSRERPPAPLVALSSQAVSQPEPLRRGLADLPSMLAPPEPVTRQERLLSLVARGARPADVALLNPAVQELVAQQREAEFNRLFPAPIPQETYLAEHTSN